jgi:hypothetical protein
MSTEYNVDEFIGASTEPTTYETEVEKKVSLLYDFCILHKHRQKADEREAAVRGLLKSYKSTVIMDNAVHDILVGKAKLDDTLKRKGFLN